MQAQASFASGHGAKRPGKGPHPAIRWMFFWLPRKRGGKPSTSTMRNPRLGAGPSMSDWTQALTTRDADIDRH
ncbi:hypothetical protein P7B02_04070 [Caulobacter segnis]|uniref:hypothetical protein n=1 Tax=Caulobacter segnis TaxID=88688 RepID=UPI00240EE06C|nr:hypothetical protein [Caulobacter segnis]MDG2520709.1 hypothetical protein [Caulobacter segnis]